MSENANYFKNTLSEIANQIHTTSKLVDWEEISRIIAIILQIKAKDKRIFIYGAGRSGFIGRCFAQRLMHLDIKSCFISDAVTYRYTKDDTLIIISGSGETVSPVAISKKAKTIGGKIVLFTNNPKSTIAIIADHIIDVRAKSKDIATTATSLAPYTSLFDISVLSILDAIAALLMKNLGKTEKDIDKFHASLE
ncbi:MAG: SIS domain-containing protein [Candidatus Thorarchaeota archaeon]